MQLYLQSVQNISIKVVFHIKHQYIFSPPNLAHKGGHRRKGPLICPYSSTYIYSPLG